MKGDWFDVAAASLAGFSLIVYLADTPAQVKAKVDEAYQQGYEEGALAATAIHEENCPKKEYECTLERMPDWTTGWVCRTVGEKKQ